jgi:hypothetical protein
LCSLIYNKKINKLENKKEMLKVLTACLIAHSIAITLLFFYSQLNQRCRTTDMAGQNSIHFNSPDSKSPQHKKNRISIEMNVMDIYRIDMTCDYTMYVLGVKVSELYANREKGCSMSALRTNLSELIAESLPKNRTSHASYSPVYSNDENYEPFRVNTPTDDKLFSQIKPGGVFIPEFVLSKPCNEKNIDNIVFVVPYTKSRLENLKRFLINMHSYLTSQRHKFVYKILVVEQMNTFIGFNKGRLFNTAFNYLVDSQKPGETRIDCIVLHDVDLIPSNSSEHLGERGDYRCRQMPWHLSRKIRRQIQRTDQVYSLFLTGGILSLRPDHFLDANGFSNEYFEWGAEDVRQVNLKIIRFIYCDFYKLKKKGRFSIEIVQLGFVHNATECQRDASEPGAVYHAQARCIASKSETLLAALDFFDLSAN